MVEVRFTFWGDFPDHICNETSSVRDMPTAILTLYTSEGWVIAADGLGTLDDGSERNENTQKIFPVEGRPLAYVLLGTTKLLKDGQVSLDLGLGISNSAKALASRNPSDAVLYLDRLCRPLHKSLLNAKNNGLVRYPERTERPPEPGATIVWVFLVGYYENRPTSAHCRLFHRNQKLAGIAPQIDGVKPGWYRAHGSEKVWNLVDVPLDITFSKYRTAIPKPEQFGLSQAIEWTKTRIQVCCDPKAKEIDPDNCNKIGGRIHIATITPERGFRWEEPPSNHATGN